MDELVQRLSQGEHPVEITIRPERTPKLLKECLDRGYVHVKFTNTRGGTELGVQLDRAASELGADLESGVGRLKLVGNLTLNYVKVQCIADVDVATYEGQGRLVPVPE